MSMKVFNAVFIIVSSIAISGCGKQIEEFVGGGSRPPPISGEPPSKALKISPGAVISNGTQAGGKFTITPTKRLAKGTTTDARLSVNATTVK